MSRSTALEVYKGFVSPIECSKIVNRWL